MTDPQQAANESARVALHSAEILRLTALKFTGSLNDQSAFLISRGWSAWAGHWYRTTEGGSYSEWQTTDEAFDHELRYLITGKAYR